MAKDEELTDADWRTLCDTLRGSITMFDMLLAECGDSSETARVVEAARQRAREGPRKDREALADDVGADLIARATAGFRVDLVKPTLEPGATCPLSAVSPRSSPPTWRGTRASWGRMKRGRMNA